MPFCETLHICKGILWCDLCQKCQLVLGNVFRRHVLRTLSSQDRSCKVIQGYQHWQTLLKKFAEVPQRCMLILQIDCVYFNTAYCWSQILSSLPVQLLIILNSICGRGGNPYQKYPASKSISLYYVLSLRARGVFNIESVNKIVVFRLDYSRKWIARSSGSNSLFRAKINRSYLKV